MVLCELGYYFFPPLLRVDTIDAAALYLLYISGSYVQCHLTIYNPVDYIDPDF